MFQIKHKITFSTGEIVSLYGEDYFGDKKVFWDSHQTQLNGLLKKARELGGPFKVVEYPNAQEHEFMELKSFTDWLSKSHPIKK